MTISEIVHTILNSTADDIRQRMASEGENATGRTSASFQVVEEDGHIRLISQGSKIAPLETLEVGRGAGKRPPIAPLEEWAQVKFGYVGKEATSVAWAVATKIAGQGTERHTNNVDIYTTPVEEATKELQGKISISIIEQVKSLIK